MLWEQQDQQAYIHFPQKLTQIELLPYIIKNEHRHLQYRDPTSFNTTYFEQINRDHNFITDYSETSDNRPYITSNISPETTPEDQTSNVVTQNTRQHSVQSEQDDLVNFFQYQEPHQLIPLYSQLPQVFDIQQLNPSETATIQTVQTVQNTQSLTITNDSRFTQVPTQNITPDETNNQNQDNILSTTQDSTSILSTSHTNVTQPSQTQRSPGQNYDPPSIPPQFSTQIHTHDSPQQGSSNTQRTNTVHFQTQTPPSPPEIQTSTYTPAESNRVQNVQTSLNTNTIHSNPPFNYTTSRNLSRPSLQPILTNPFSYNLTSTNSSHTQQSSRNNNRPNSLRTFPPPQTSNTTIRTLQNSQFQIPNPPSTNIRTNPHFHNTPTTPFTITSNVPTYNTVPPSTISQNTISQPTYINSSTSISELIKRFDGLDQNDTPEEYLQHIEARFTFSLGLQPTSENQYKFWHARRMVFIQCSLTGTALSWYIRLNDTYKQDYIRYKTLEVTPSQNPFQVIVNPVKRISTGTYFRTVHPQNITLPIQDVFITYMQKLIEFNENQDTPLYLPSHLEDLKHKSEYLRSQTLKQEFRDTITLIIGYSKIYYK